MKIFMSVGEPSGDLHGANLITRMRQLRSDLEFVGYGGPRMAAAGCQLHEDLTQLAIMGFARVISNLHRFWSLYRRAERVMVRERPDAVVLIDYPGFNWWIARAAKRQGIPVFYYGPPQMWAWAAWRVGKMQRLVDHVLCKLPFEADWYARRGCNASYVGHPYFDQLEKQQLDQTFLSQFADAEPLVTILPGSRDQEVSNHLPWFCDAARRVAGSIDSVRFAVASYDRRQAEQARRAVAAAGIQAEVFVGRTAELIHAAKCCIACSGSVSLELMYHEKPSVIFYRVGRVLHWLGRRVVTSRYVTLVNLLASADPLPGKWTPHDLDHPSAEPVPFPEYPTYENKSEQIAQHISQWLMCPEKYQATVNQLRNLKQRFARSGASQTAARYILGKLPGRGRRAA